MRREEESGTIHLASKLVSHPSYLSLHLVLTWILALRDYEDRVTDFTYELIERILTFSGTELATVHQLNAPLPVKWSVCNLKRCSLRSSSRQLMWFESKRQLVHRLDIY